jgi:DNA polymerase V
MSNNRGGTRPGAGRPHGTGKYKHPTTVVRIPENLLPAVRILLQNPPCANPTNTNHEISPTLYPNGDGIAALSSVSQQTKPILIPLYESRVAAGFPSPASDYEEGKIDLNDMLIRHPAATFLVRVQGESMLGAGIHPNDILVVDRSLTPAHGRIVIAVVDGELTVKRLHKTQSQIILMPENEAFSPLPISEQQNFMVWGVVTNVIHSVL